MRAARTRLLWLGLALPFVAILAQAQFKPAHPTSPPQPEQRQMSEGQPTFSVKVNLVRLLVSVRDRFGALLTNLNKSDFNVLDSGISQDIAVFERNTSLPLSVAILIDTSGSTQIDLHYEVNSIQRFIPTLLGAGNPDDTFALFSFNWRTNLEADFSRNAAESRTRVACAKGRGRNFAI